MRKMRKFLNILFLCTLALGLSSCEPDDGEDYYIYDTLLGGIWVGDLGFADAYNSPLESGLYFEGNGLGRDEQAYYNDPYGEVAFSLPFRWDIHGRILRLDYGYDYPCWKSTTYMLRETDCPVYYTWTGTWMGLSCWKGNIKNMDVRTS